MSLTSKYVRKPFTVEAVKVTEENMEEVARWCNGTIVDFDETTNTPTAKFIKVRVHHPQSDRQTKAFVDDYVLYAAKGYKCYTEKAFNNTFDDVFQAPVEVPQPAVASDPAQAPVPTAPKVITDAKIVGVSLDSEPGPHGGRITSVGGVDVPGTVRGEDGEVLYDPTLSASPGISHVEVPNDGVTDAYPGVQAAIDKAAAEHKLTLEDPEVPETIIEGKDPEPVAPGVEAIGEVAGEPTDLCAQCGVTRAFHDTVAYGHEFHMSPTA